MPRYDAIVVGAGPNGLAAAALLARTGRSVLVREAQDTIGGGSRSQALTLPGFTHDVCSAIHPMAFASPVFRLLELERHGLEWLHPDAPLAHPLDDGTAIVLERSVAATGAHLDPGDDRAWTRLVEPLATEWEAWMWGPRGLAAAAAPLLLPRAAALALRSARGVSHRFRGPRAKALLAGIAAHAAVPLDEPANMSFTLALALSAHAVGWPFPRGGSQAIPDALASVVRAHGGTIESGAPVDDLDALDADLVMLDLSPAELLRIAAHRLPHRYRRRLERFVYGPGVFKLDWALSEPVPWRADECRRAATLHLGGSWTEIAASEAAPWRGEAPRRPYVLLAQPSLWDDTRAPPGRHTLWAYCHVPNGCTVDMTDRIEDQIERFAPGFRDVVLARSVRPPSAVERHDANMRGGDAYGGANLARQVLFRPLPRVDPYRVPVRGRSVWLCSASTPPGGAVHGLCGWLATQAALASTGGTAGSGGPG